MISVPTTFVVGAGASVPYGLPAARGLRDQARRLSPNDDAYQLLIALGVDAPRLNDVLGDIREHPAESIDAFLESRQDRPDVMQIGRLLIAALMGRALSIARQGQGHALADADWLAYIIDRMRRGASTWEQFAKGNSTVRFVTFNFDSVIEDRLTRAVSSIYRGQSVNMSYVLKAIRVDHVHGRMPPIPDAKWEGSVSSTGVDAKWIGWIAQAAASINVVLDSINEDTRKTCVDAVDRCRVLCFLGFAYDPENLKRLNLPKMFGTRLEPLEVFGSAFDLLDGEQAGIRRRFLNRIGLGGAQDDCRRVLRMFDIFKD